MNNTDKHLTLQEVVAKLQAGGAKQIKQTWADIQASHTLLKALKEFGFLQRKTWIKNTAFPPAYAARDVAAALKEGNHIGELNELANGVTKLKKDAAGNPVPKAKTGSRGYQVIRCLPKRQRTP